MKKDRTYHVLVLVRLLRLLMLRLLGAGLLRLLVVGGVVRHVVRMWVERGLAGRLWLCLGLLLELLWLLPLRLLSLWWLGLQLLWGLLLRLLLRRLLLLLLREVRCHGLHTRHWCHPCTLRLVRRHVLPTGTIRTILSAACLVFLLVPVVVIALPLVLEGFCVSGDGRAFVGGVCALVLSLVLVFAQLLVDGGRDDGADELLLHAEDFVLAFAQWWLPLGGDGCDGLGLLGFRLG